MDAIRTKSSHRTVYVVNGLESSFPEFAFSSFHRCKDQICMVDEWSGKSYRFSEIQNLALKVSSWLKMRGLKPGEMICICARNCSDVILAYLGITAARGCCTFANSLLSKDELRYQAQDSGAVYIIADEECSQKALQVMQELPQVRDVFLVGNEKNCMLELAKNASKTAFSQLEKIEPSTSPAVVFYSSGTTGIPKGVVHTHRTIIGGILECSDIPFLDVYNKGVMLCALPMSHIFPFLMIFAALTRGSKVVFLRKFEYETFTEVLDAYKVTFLPVVPTIIEMLLERGIPKNLNIDSVTTIFCGGDVLNPNTIKMIGKLLKSLQFVINVYGSTEFSIIYMTLFDITGTSIVGMQPSSTQIKIVDDKLNEIQLPYEKGKILVKKQIPMAGYLNRLEETQKSLNEDGWAETGDTGYFEEENLVVVGREKNMIKYKGHQLSPLELESVIQSHECVLTAVVIGIPDSLCGELPRSYIILKEKCRQVTAKEIADYVAARTAPYKHLRGGVEFVKELPKSTVGKVLRRQILEDYLKKTGSFQDFKSTSSHPLS